MKSIEKAMNFLRSYTMRVPMWLRLVLILPAFIIPAYWAFTFSGWYKSLSEWQAEANGDYFPAFSYLVPCLVLLMFVLPLLVILGNFFPEKPEQETKMGHK